MVVCHIILVHLTPKNKLALRTIDSSSTKARKKYQAYIQYGGTTKNLGSFDTKEQAGIAYDRFVVDKSTEEVSFTLNYPNGLPTSGSNKDGNNDTDLPTTTIKQDPEAELILNKTEEVHVHVKSEPEAEF